MADFVSIMALILAIIAMILIVLVFIALYFSTNIWTYRYGNILAGADTFTPTYNSIYKPNVNGGLTLTIQSNTNGIIGETFMIDNTQNPNVIVVKNSSNITITDDIGGGNISANTSALYIWSGTSSINRLN